MGKSEFELSVDRFLRLIAKDSPKTLFNPWKDVNARFDMKSAPSIRKSNLRQYLLAHENARAILVGEAAGWAGCRFTGIPFTGENLITGDERLEWASGRPMKRSSLAEKPYKERSATIVWGEIAGDSRLVLWNAVPWHPYKPGSPYRTESLVGESRTPEKPSSPLFSNCSRKRRHMRSGAYLRKLWNNWDTQQATFAILLWEGRKSSVRG